MRYDYAITHVSANYLGNIFHAPFHFNDAGVNTRFI